MKRLTTSSLFFIFIVFLCANMMAQDVGNNTLISQSRTTTANISRADITIKYHSPSVNGRKIFGGIVPYDFNVDGKEFPWRAGANQRTTISFSHDVKINGQDLPAGDYGFLVLVEELEWTLIFSSGKSWGAFNYDSQNDVLRVGVKPQKIAFQEWLSYEFNNPQNESVDVALRWEETSVSFQVTTDATANILSDLNKKEKKSSEDYRQLAIRTLEQDPSQIGQALMFIDQSLEKLSEIERDDMRKVNEFFIKMIKADLLLKKGEVAEGKKLKEEMLKSATGFNMYYYTLRKYTVEGKKVEAYKLLKAAIERQPDNFQNHFAMGEYYLQERKQEKATEHFKKAYEMTMAQESGWLNYARYLYYQNKLVLESGSSR